MKDAGMKLVDEVGDALRALEAIEDLVTPHGQMNDVLGGNLATLLRLIRERGAAAVDAYLKTPKLGSCA